MSAAAPTGIDWSRFDAMSQMDCACRCGATFRSHASIQMLPAPHLVSRLPCPRCGGFELQRASSDPESMTVGAGDVGGVEP